MNQSARQQKATHKQRKRNVKVKNKAKQGMTFEERKRLAELERRRPYVLFRPHLQWRV